MDTQETKDHAFTPLQELKQDTRELRIGYDWLKFLGKGIFTFLALFAAFVFFLFTRIESRIDKLESGIQENRKLLIQLIQSQAKPARYKA